MCGARPLHVPMPPAPPRPVLAIVRSRHSPLLTDGCACASAGPAEAWPQLESAAITRLRQADTPEASDLGRAGRHRLAAPGRARKLCPPACTVLMPPPLAARRARSRTRLDRARGWRSRRISGASAACRRVCDAPLMHLRATCTSQRVCCGCRPRRAHCPAVASAASLARRRCRQLLWEAIPSGCTRHRSVAH